MDKTLYEGDRVIVRYKNSETGDRGEFKLEIINSKPDRVDGFVGRRKRDGKRIYVSPGENKVGVEGFTGISWIGKLLKFSMAEDF